MTTPADTPTRVGAARRRWTHRGDVPVGVLIEAAWDELAEMQEAGRLSSHQFGGLVRRADEMDPSPVGQYLVLGMLRRAIAAPTQVGVNPEALAAPYPCRCGPGRGMVLADAAADTWKPCDRCNPGAYALYIDCYLPGCRGCERCRPTARRRGFQGDHRAEAAETQRAERARRTMDDLR